jgi:hypothetical protein
LVLASPNAGEIISGRGDTDDGIGVDPPELGRARKPIVRKYVERGRPIPRLAPYPQSDQMVAVTRFPLR